MTIRKETIISILVFLLGASAAFGELANDFIPFASLMFVMLGFVIIIYSLVFLRLPSWKNRECRLIIVSFVFYTIYQGVYIMSHSMDGEGIIGLFKVPIFLLTAFFVIRICVYEHQNLDYLMLGFIVGFLIAIPLGTMKMYAVTRMTGTYSNPNNYALDCNLFVYSSLYLLFKKKKGFFAFTMVLGIVMVFLTGSRGALLAMSIGLALFILDFKKLSLKNILLALSGIIVVLVLLIFADQIPLLQRLFKSEYGENVRLEIWKAYILNVDKYFLFGIDETEMRTIHHFTPHSSILSPFVRYGIIAFLLYLALDVCIWIKSIKNLIHEDMNEVKAAFCAYVVVFFSSFTIEIMTTRSKYMFLIIVLSIILQKQEDDDIIEDLLGIDIFSD